MSGEMKRCSKCGEEKPIADFQQRRAACRDCETARKIAWATANRERDAARKAAWEERNREKRVEIRQRWLERNHEQRLEAQRRYKRRLLYAELLHRCQKHAFKIRGIRPVVLKAYDRLEYLHAQRLERCWEVGELRWEGQAYAMRYEFDRKVTERTIAVLGGDLARMEAELARLAELRAEFGSETKQARERRAA